MIAIDCEAIRKIASGVMRRRRFGCRASLRRLVGVRRAVLMLVRA